MYSSQWKGYVTDPALMTVPIDDHLVHRGDGVFDVMRCVAGKIYQMEAHLNRLESSAKSISLAFPPEYGRIREIISTLVLAGGERDCAIRVILSRGPGSFSTNPNDCPASQIYVNVVRFHPLPEDHYSRGICIVTSRIPIKRSYFARIKSCDYLPNVLMKMEAIEKGCHYAIALDEDGFLAEGSTENIGIVSRDGFIKIPAFEKTLAGTTASRIFELASTLEGKGMIKGIRFEQIPLIEAHDASEVFLIGTSLNVLPVVGYDGKTIGTGVPGPVSKALSNLLWEDMTGNDDLLTDMGWGR
jgi:branched-chain amino acid aminotransferase